MHLAFTLNGAPCAVEAPAKASALALLRDQLGLTTLKAGCAPQGVCGCCMALINGKPRLTCTLPAKTLAGKEVLTPEGLPPEAAAAYAQAFAAAGAGPCGACTAGVAMSVHALLEADPDPAPAAITAALQAHLCRCTGPNPLRAAVPLAARFRRDPRIGDPPPGEPRIGDPRIGDPRPGDPRLGGRPFVDDLRRPGLLHLALAWAPAAQGRLAAVDLSAAQQVPGLIEILTAGPAGLFVAPGDTLRGADAVLALVIAADPAAAQAAAEAITARVEPLPAEAPVCAAERIEVIGAGEAAFAGAAHLIEETFTTARAEPATLSPEGALAVPHDGGFTLWSGGPDPRGGAQQLVERFGLSAGALRWVATPVAGSFGARPDPFLEAYALLAAQRTGRPCRLRLRLAEAVRLRPHRPPTTLRLRLAADADGRLLALSLQADLDVGVAPQGDLLGPLLRSVAGPYAIPHQHLVARAWTRAGPAAGALVGAGLVEATFAREGAIDRLAAALGADPLALRRAHLALPGAAACLDALAPAYAAAVEAGRSVGLALAVERPGPAAAQVALAVRPGPQVALCLPIPDAGDDGLLGLAAEATGLPRTLLFREATSDRPLRRVGRDLLGGATLDAAAALRRAPGTLEDKVGQTFFGAVDLPAPAPRCAAQVALLDGEGRLEAIAHAQEVGQPRSHLALTGPLEGAVAMGIGLALSEELGLIDGLPDGRFARYGLLKAKGAPPVQLHLIEEPDPAGPTGPRGLLDLGMAPTAAALAAAIARWEGAFRVALPMRDSAAAKGIGARAKA